MKNKIVFYPTVGKELLNKINCHIDGFSASYSTRHDTYELICNEDGDSFNRIISVVDDNGRWSLDEHNFELKGTICIDNIEPLFETNGVAADDAVLGIGLVYKSRTSSIRSAEPIGEIRSGDGKVKVDFNKAFGAAKLRGYLSLSFEIYIIDPGSASMQLNKGVSLGELYSVLLILEGLGSTFTVLEKSAPGEPLWDIACDWDDPEYSPFSESVKVTINNAHPAWLCAADEEMRKELLKEIMATSMQVVIAELDDSQKNPNGDYEPGSVCDAIAYFIGRAGLDMESNASIAKTIRTYLDKNMG